MTNTELRKHKFPDAPGVYFFLDSKGKPLYIGRATSLRDRVRSYFNTDIVRSRGPAIAKMLAQAKRVRVESTDSVLEAIILEANLIKRYQPCYNAREKDDRSFNYLIITDEPFPRLLVIRGRELAKRAGELPVKYQFGPFPCGGMFREAMRLVRKIFPFRDVCTPLQGRPCFNRQIGLCPGVCTGEVSRQEYARTVKHLKLFFDGKKRALVATLKREMKSAARAQEFETAERLKRTLFALTHIQDVALIRRESEGGRGGSPPAPGFRVEAYDVAHIAGRQTVGAMTVVESGEVRKSGYRKFKVRKETAGDDVAALREILERRLGHLEWPLPDLIVVDGGKLQLNAATAALARAGFSIPVVSVVKDEFHRPRELLGDRAFRSAHEQAILLANSEAHRFAVGFHRQVRRRRLKLGR